METKPQQETGVTMSDFLTDMLKEEQDMQNILEKDETKKCTYEKGYITQTLFGCHTCGAKGGMCLACYLNCHLDHDTFEIGLKRNFRCDCGTDKFNKHPCSMLEEAKTEENVKNNYDHNFAAKFCSCNQNYEQNQFMIRCLHCFDYYHLYHLNIPEDIQGIVEGNEDFTQMICGTCVDKHYKFLYCYNGGNIYYTDQELRDSAKEEEEEKKEATLEKKNSEGSALLGKRTRSFEESCDFSEKVKQFDNINDKKPIFVKENWNNNLCYCESCQKMYKDNGVVEVLEEEVTNAESWEQPVAPEAQVRETTPDDIFRDGSLYNQAMQELSKLDFATQSTIAGLYRDFYDDFKEFFEKFKDTLITQDHIQEFFAFLKTKKKEAVSI